METDTSQRARSGRVSEPAEISSDGNGAGSPDTQALPRADGRESEDGAALEIGVPAGVARVEQDADEEVLSGAQAYALSPSQQTTAFTDVQRDPDFVIVGPSDGAVDLEFLATAGTPAAIDLPSGSSAARGVARRIVVPQVSIDDRLGRVLLSIVLAILLWLYVAYLENPTVSTQFTDLTVEVRGLGDSLKVVSPLPTVLARVEAPQSVLGRLSKGDIQPYVDVAGLQEGVHQVRIGAEVSNPQASDVRVNFSPQFVQLQLEVQVSKTMSVEVQMLGTPAFGYGLETAQVRPNEVTASGPQESVDRVARVLVEVDVDDKAATQQGSKSLVAFDANGQEVTGLTFDPETVEVVVPITLLLNNRAVPVSVPVIGQPAPGYRVSTITVEPTNVTLCCSPSLLEEVEFISTEPVAITGTTSTVVTTTQLIFPPRVELYPGQPKEIKVTVSVEVLETTLRLSVAPTVEGAGGGLQAVVSPNQLQLTLAGTFAQLQGLSPTEVRAVVNLEGRGAGTYSLRPDISLPQGIKLEGMTPDEVTVVLIPPTPVPTPTATPLPATATPTAQPTAQATATLPAATSTAAATAAAPATTPTLGPPAVLTDTLAPEATPPTVEVLGP